MTAHYYQESSYPTTTALVTSEQQYHSRPQEQQFVNATNANALDAFLHATGSRRAVSTPDLLSVSSVSSTSSLMDHGSVSAVYHPRTTTTTTSHDLGASPFAVVQHTSSVASHAMVPYAGGDKQIMSTCTPEEEDNDLSADASASTTLVVPDHWVVPPPACLGQGSDAIHPRRQKMKGQRKTKTVAGAVSGMVVGGLTLGPAGVFLGGAAGAWCTKALCKARERRAQRKWEQANFQEGTYQSQMVLQDATFA